MIPISVDGKTIEVGCSRDTTQIWQLRENIAQVLGVETIQIALSPPAIARCPLGANPILASSMDVCVIDQVYSPDETIVVTSNPKDLIEQVIGDAPNDKPKRFIFYAAFGQSRPRCVALFEANSKLESVISQICQNETIPVQDPKRVFALKANGSKTLQSSRVLSNPVSNDTTAIIVEKSQQ